MRVRAVEEMEEAYPNDRRVLISEILEMSFGCEVKIFGRLWSKFERGLQTGEQDWWRTGGRRRID